MRSFVFVGLAWFCCGCSTDSAQSNTQSDANHAVIPIETFTIPAAGSTRLNELSPLDVNGLCEAVVDASNQHRINARYCSAEAIAGHDIEPGPNGESRCLDYVARCETSPETRPGPFNDWDECQRNFGHWVQQPDCRGNVYQLEACLGQMLNAAIQIAAEKAQHDCSIFSDVQGYERALERLNEVAVSAMGAISSPQCTSIIEQCPTLFNFEPGMPLSDR